MGLDTRTHFCCGTTKTILLPHQDAHHLPPACQHGAECLGIGVPKRACRWTNGLAEVRQNPGIQPVSLRQLPSGPGEVPHLAGIDDCHRQRCRGQSCNQLKLQAAGGLRNHCDGSETDQLVHKLVHTGLIILHAPTSAGGANGDIYLLLGHIDANVGGLLLHVHLPYGIGPALQDTGLVSPGNRSGSNGMSAATLAFPRSPTTNVRPVCRTQGTMLVTEVVHAAQRYNVLWSVAPKQTEPTGVIVVDGVADGLSLACRRTDTVVILFGTSTFRSTVVAGYLARFRRMRVYAAADGAGRESAHILVNAVRRRSSSQLNAYVPAQGKDPAEVAESEPPLAPGRPKERELAVDLMGEGLPMWEACRLAWTTLRYPESDIGGED